MNDFGQLISSTSTSFGNQVDVRYQSPKSATVHLDGEWIGTLFSTEDAAPPFVFALLCGDEPGGMARLYLDEFETVPDAVSACVETELERRMPNGENA
jgi:hypothetical protein